MIRKRANLEFGTRGRAGQRKNRPRFDDTLYIPLIFISRCICLFGTTFLASFEYIWIRKPRGYKCQLPLLPDSTSVPEESGSSENYIRMLKREVLRILVGVTTLELEIIKRANRFISPFHGFIPDSLLIVPL